MSQSVEAIQAAFKQLRLAEMSHALPQLLRQAEKHSWTYMELLTEITDFELKQREAKSIERRLK